MDSRVNPDSAAALHARALMSLSGAFMLDQVASGMAGLDPRDALLVMAINQANIAPLTRDPAARARYGALETPAPDDERRPVSLSAIACSLGLPYETVRRRVGRLHALGVCQLGAHGAVVPESFLASPPYMASVVAAYVRLHRFYLDVSAADLMPSLPPSRYPPEPTAPVRASLRIIADYLLRTSEALIALTGDLVSSLAFLAVLSEGETPPPSSVSAIARRLAMPQETVRRHCAALVEAGWCARVDRTFTVTPEILARPEVTALISENAVGVHRLFAALAERGLIEAWRRLGPPTAGRP